jgi:UDP:flavonoid glycosyltransferase YjiC (YdhE family)
VKVLFTCVVGHGHFNPMVPLAHALEAAGHLVAFATDPSFCVYVREEGFEAHPAGLDQPDALAQFVASTPGWREMSPEDRQPIQYSGMFGRVRAPAMLRDLVPLVTAWQPDLLIHDAGEMAGAIAAEAAGIAHVEHSFGILRSTLARSLATEAIQPLATELGVPNPGVGGSGGELYLDICPPGIQDPEISDVPNVQRLRPLWSDGATDPALLGWLAGLPSRPTVYVTMGTVFNKASDVFRAVLEGLREEALNVIVTVGPSGDPAGLGPQPENVHVERYIPQSQLLPLCDLFVSHGGSGALLGALSAGVPMLAIPQGADQFINAKRVVEAGFGLRLMPSELTSDAVRSAARRLIDDGQFVEVARVQQAAIAEMPDPSAVVPVLEALVQ